MAPKIEAKIRWVIYTKLYEGPKLDALGPGHLYYLTTIDWFNQKLVESLIEKHQRDGNQGQQKGIL